jgi:cellulose synthase/poly-beta-1,6-N-acetylglucosamine synthase-like glycosyltransferase
MKSLIKQQYNSSLAATSVLERPILSQEEKTSTSRHPNEPSFALYGFIFSTWLFAVVWFQPRLWQLMDMAYNLPSKVALITFILFINFAWLYGMYNLGVVLFALVYRWFPGLKSAAPRVVLEEFPSVALLYTTCNDFLEESVISCVDQDYPSFKVYILDDSSAQEYKDQVDAFAARYPGLVEVVRRPDRKAFKAGNMNHGLSKVATEEPYFAIADADEILPPDFLSKLVPVMESDPNCGFVQANHRSNPNNKSQLARDLGVGIDIHWKWYQPLRNDYGFVMFLGHGALLRRKCWEEIGGFPDIVSEDLGFAIQAREKGYRGRFVEDVICYEDFPDTVRAFRIRHMKWTRGTSEFLSKMGGWLLKAKNITWAEKLDILFPTLNLPLTLLYFLFMLNANLALPYFFGDWANITYVLAGKEIVFPVLILNSGFEVIYDWDFFIITILTFFAPVLCFLLALAHRPLKLFKFLSHSTALYAALSPLSSLGVIAYMISGKAIFLVTGDVKQADHKRQKEDKDWWTKVKASYQKFITKSHPDQGVVQWFEILTGLGFIVMCVYMFQISFFGLCLAFILLPVMHHLGWEHKLVRGLVYLPFVLILFGIFLASLSMIGLQAVFFGYGFHF